MKHSRILACLIGAVIGTISISVTANAVAVKNPVQAVPNIGIEKPTKIIMYSGGCFDAKAGNKFLLRCV